MAQFFSDREREPKARTETEITNTVWRAIASCIGSRMADGSLGCRYPLMCQDGRGPFGCNEEAFISGLMGLVPDLQYGLASQPTPPTLAVLDALEFCYEVIAEPRQRDWHAYYSHYHLQFDVVAGQGAFQEEVNRLLARNGLAFEMRSGGRVQHVAYAPLAKILAVPAFDTGDARLDELLEAARSKCLDPDATLRREGLEKLWDAWERLKSLEDKDKRVSISILLDEASAKIPGLREFLESEGKQLTSIGNEFQIRHTEAGRIPVDSELLVDYFFHRCFALIRFLLEATGRGEY